MASLTFQPVFGSWIAAAFLTLIVLGAVSLFPIKGERLAPFRRRVLFACRLLSLLIFGFLLLRPAVETEESRRLPASLAILVDSSESMGVRDLPDGRSRFESVRNLTETIHHERNHLPDDLTLLAFEFDETPRPLLSDHGRLVFSEKPLGAGTEIGRTLDAVLARTAGKRLLGILLLSDGTQRSRTSTDGESPSDVAFRYRDAGIPIYSLCVGSTDNADARRDLAVAQLNVPGRVFVQNEAVVTGQIQATGFKGKPFSLTLSFEDAQGELVPIDRLELLPDSDDRMIPFQFTFRPDAPGERKLVVSMAPQEGEILTDNNAGSAFIQVVEGCVFVFFLNGSRRFEDKFIRMALESTAEIGVDYWRPESDPSIRPEGKTETERVVMTTGSRPALTETVFKGDDYSVFILGNLDADCLKKEEMDYLKKRVIDGAGLIVLGGERALSAGGYAATSLADLFPTTLDPDLRLPISLDLETFEKGRGPEERIYYDGSFRVRPTESGGGHYLAQLSVDRNRNREIWNRLSPLEGVTRFGKIKPGALTVLEGESESGGGETVPILTTQLYGSGRVTVLAADSTWKWSMGGFQDEFQKFWRQLVLWSAGADELKAGDMTIQLDRPRFFEEEPVEFQVVYKPTPETPPESLRPQAAVVTPGGEEIPISLTGEGETFVGKFDRTSETGDYQIRVFMKDSRGRNLQNANARFSVWTVHHELETPIASPAVMKNLAEITGGRSIRPDEWPVLFQELAQKKESIVEAIRTRRTLYDRWPVFIALLLLLTAEWFLRKKWGLV